MINARHAFAPVVLAVALLVLSQPVLAYSDAGIDIQTSVNATCPCTTLTPEDVNVIVPDAHRALHVAASNLPGN